MISNALRAPIRMITVMLIISLVGGACSSPEGEAETHWKAGMELVGKDKREDQPNSIRLLD